MTKKNCWRILLIWSFLMYLLPENVRDTRLIILLLVVIYLTLETILKMNFFMQYRLLKEYFEFLKGIHKKRYQAYFSNNKEEISYYSEEIAEIGQQLLTVGNYWLTQKLKNKQKAEIQYIVSKTEEMMTKEFVTF